MKFTTPAGTNPIDQLQVVGRPLDRIDGPLKTTGQAPYAYEQPVANAAYGYIIGAGIAKGRIASIDTRAALRAPGVLAIVTHENAGTLSTGEFYVAHALAGPKVEHYHQAVAIVVAGTFEEARAAAHLVKVRYAPEKGAFSLAAQIFDRMGIEVLISTENDKDFENNMVTIRAEERLAFAVYRPEAFVTGPLIATP